MKTKLFNSNFLLKILECIVLSVVFLIDKPNLYTIIFILVSMYIINKIFKVENIKHDYDKITIYEFIVETSSLIYYFSLFDEATIMYKVLIYIITIILILFEKYIMKIDFMNKVISHNMIAIPFVILLLVSLPR